MGMSKFERGTSNDRTEIEPAVGFGVNRRGGESGRFSLKGGLIRRVSATNGTYE